MTIHNLIRRHLTEREQDQILAHLEEKNFSGVNKVINQSNIDENVKDELLNKACAAIANKD